VTNMLNPFRIAIWTAGVMACSGVDSPAPRPGTPPAAQGIVAGVVQDSAGRGIPNATVCAVTAFTVSGTPTLVARQASTNANGAYVVPINLTFKVEVRAPLTVTATPAAGTGLAPASGPGDSVMITAMPPPSETAHVNVVVPKGPPYDGVLCIFGTGP
jgi:hypothetical protein